MNRFTTIFAVLLLIGATLVTPEVFYLVALAGLVSTFKHKLFKALAVAAVLLALYVVFPAGSISLFSVTVMTASVLCLRYQAVALLKLAFSYFRELVVNPLLAR